MSTVRSQVGIRPVPTGLAVVLEMLFGLLTAVLLLIVLADTVGLDGPAWTIGLASTVVIATGLAKALLRSGAVGIGWANRVTLARANLAAAVAALVVDSFSHPVPAAVLVGLTVLALILDAVDGRVARRTDTVSAVGARFDMEVDAFLLLVLSASLARSLGPWVLLIGAARYLLVAAGWWLRWLQAPAPPRFWCKVVAAIQGIVLTVGLTGLLPNLVLVAVVAVALALLVESFGREVLQKWRGRIPARTSREENGRQPAISRITEREGVPRWATARVPAMSPPMG